jgi:hypothetical protein
MMFFLGFLLQVSTGNLLCPSGRATNDVGYNGFSKKQSHLPVNVFHFSPFAARDFSRWSK